MKRTRCTSGATPTTILCCNSPTVSRFHAIVERVGQRYRVRDLNSSNGTYVNDQRITGETWLKAGDSIRVGPYRFVVGQDQLPRCRKPAACVWKPWV